MGQAGRWGGTVQQLPEAHVIKVLMDKPKSSQKTSKMEQQVCESERSSLNSLDFSFPQPPKVLHVQKFFTLWMFGNSASLHHCQQHQSLHFLDAQLHPQTQIQTAGVVKRVSRGGGVTGGVLEVTLWM